MPPRDDPEPAAGPPRRLFHVNLSFLRDARLRRILALAGHDLRLGRPGAGDGVLVWGQSPVAARGEALARRYGAPLVRAEDAFLRSLRPGRMGDATLGLMLDATGVHFDGRAPSALETLLATHPLDASDLMGRARDGMARLAALHLSKYNLHDPGVAAPAPGYVLVIDQTRDDASVRASGASERTFREMLILAQEEHPRAPVVIKTHPETAQGLRPGHYDDGDLNGRVSFAPADISPHTLLAGAVAVYVVSSQMGFEAIVAGHRPQVFGTPFYTGWGLSEDRNPTPHSLRARRRTLTRAQLFAGAMLLAPLWYDPCRDRLCRFEQVVDQLEAEVRAFRQDRAGHVAAAMRLWKRGRLQAVFGQHQPLIFRADPQAAAALATRLGRPLLIWAGKEPPGLAAPAILRVEDGFLRSRGLGADLIAPLSLVTDDLGIYYDPTRPSRLEALIAAPLPPGGRARALALIETLTGAGVTKYNTGARALPPLPDGPRLLVPGQVEDDASILTGAGPVRTNLGLLEAAMAAHPGSAILYKPHPDVEAGLRPGAIAALPAGVTALPGCDAAALLAVVDGVWTMTSLLGFEALLRGVPVTTLGAPFYAGWGLTRDLGPVPERRRRAPDGHPLPRPDLAALAHAALIAYPRYYDPVSRRPCPPEVVLHRLIHGPLPGPGPANRLLAKLQGALASRAHLWR